MKKILLISNKLMHYRVSIYNYFYDSFNNNNFEFIVRTNELQAENKNRIKFDLKEIPFEFNKYKEEIIKINPDIIIVFLHLKDKILWPLVHWIKIKKIPFTYWTKGKNLDDPNNVFKNLFFRYIHSLSDGLILYSKNEIKYIRKKNHYKISIANNTINFNDYPNINKSKEEIKYAYDIQFKKIALFVGRMGVGCGRKKVSHAIKIFNEINENDYGLVIVGSGLSNDLKNRINKKNTIYLGEIHDQDNIKISEIFKMSDVFLIPGHVGLGINQAFYWGLPTITEEGGQPPEVSYLSNGRNGFIVKENDIDDLKNKLLYLLNNDELRQKFSKQARKDILENASVENMFNGFLENIKKIEYIYNNKINQRVLKK